LEHEKGKQATAGWESRKNCEFPQFIVIQFPCPVHITQMQFLVHETKTPKRIYLYSYVSNDTDSPIKLKKPVKVD